MSNRELANALFLALADMRAMAPYDTGNLSRNAIKIEQLGDNVWRVYVDETVAPYTKYTNENWGQFKSPLQGKQNPNEGWWQDAVIEFIKYVGVLIGAQNTEDIV